LSDTRVYELHCHYSTILVWGPSAQRFEGLDGVPRGIAVDEEGERVEGRGDQRDAGERLPSVASVCHRMGVAKGRNSSDKSNTRGVHAPASAT